MTETRYVTEQGTEYEWDLDEAKAVPDRLEEASMAPDLRMEVQDLRRRRERFEFYAGRVWKDGKQVGEMLELLWAPGIQRAGIGWGGNADWTDAESPNDAMRRYFAGEMAE